MPGLELRNLIERTWQLVGAHLSPDAVVVEDVWDDLGEGAPIGGTARFDTRIGALVVRAAAHWRDGDRTDRDVEVTAEIYFADRPWRAQPPWALLVDRSVRAQFNVLGFSVGGSLHAVFEARAANDRWIARAILGVAEIPQTVVRPDDFAAHAFPHPHVIPALAAESIFELGDDGEMGRWKIALDAAGTTIIVVDDEQLALIRAWRAANSRR